MGNAKKLAKRIARSRDLLDQYKLELGESGVPDQDSVTDLISDLLHWAVADAKVPATDPEAQSDHVDGILATAKMNFEHEQAGDEPDDEEDDGRGA